MSTTRFPSSQRDTDVRTISQSERRTWYAVGTVLTVAAIASTAIGVRLGSNGTDEIESQTHTYSQPVNRIVVPDLASGDLTIIADSEGDSVRVDRQLHWENGVPEAKPKPVEAWRGQTLTVGRQCPDSGDACSIDYVIHVPAGVSALVQMSAGDLKITGVSGALDLKASSGDIEINEPKGAVKAESNSGDIKVNDARSSAMTAQTTSGDIKLYFSTAPATVLATVTSGDIEISVPDVDFDIKADVTSGDLNINARNNSTSARTITAKATSGDISIS